jgi:hypothetical protein
MIDFENENSKILYELLYGSTLSLEEHEILDDLIENRLYQLDLREDNPTEEIKQLQDLSIKLGKIFKKEHGK